MRSVNTTGTTLPIRDNLVEDEWGISDQGIAVYVQPPARRMVRISTANNEYGDFDDYDDDYGDVHHMYDESFFLSFPHVVFRLHYFRSHKGDRQHRKYTYKPDSLRVAFASQAKPSKLYVPPLFNLDAVLRVCVTLPHKYFATLEEAMKESVKAFWATKFEDSMYEAYGQHYERKSLMGDPRKWQKKTKKQPEWIPNGRSLELYHIRMGKFCSAAHIRHGDNDEDAYNDWDY